MGALLEIVLVTLVESVAELAPRRVQIIFWATLALLVVGVILWVWLS
jgi:hypothetical protein